MGGSTLYDVQSRQPAELPFEQIPDAILSGTHSYPASAKVNILDKSGQSFSLPATQLVDALKQGYRLESPDQQAVREYVNENDNMLGSAKVALKSFVDEATFGAAEVARKKLQSPLDNAKEEALKEESPLANATGFVGGLAASLFGGAEVGLFSKAIAKGAGETAVRKGLMETAGGATEKVVASALENIGIKKGSESIAKDLIARTAVTAAKMGAEGAVIASPRAVTEAMLGDPKAAVESLLAGGLSGAILGGVIGPLGKPYEALLERGAVLPEAEAATQKSFLERMKLEKAQDALGLTTAERNKIGTDKAQELAEYILNARTEAGEKLIGIRTDEANLAMVKKFNEEANAKLNAGYKILDEIPGGERVSVPQILSKIDEALTSKYSHEITSVEANLLGKIKSDLERIAIDANGEMRHEISFREARDYLQTLQEIAYPKGRKVLDPSPRMIVAREMYQNIREGINNAAERSAEKLGNPELLANFQKARADVANSIPVIKTMEKMINRRGNKGFGLTDTIAAAAGASGFGVPAAIAGVGVKKLVEKYGDQVLANLDSFAPQFLMKSMSDASKKLDRLPEAIEATKRLGKVAYIGRFEKAAETLEQKHADKKKLKERVTYFAANPGTIINEATKHVSSLDNLGAPKSAQELGVKVPQIVDYVNKIMPKPLTPPSPLMPEQEFKASDAEEARFDRQMKVIKDPFSVIDDLAKGTLTHDQVETLMTVYPRIFQAIQARTINHLAEKRPALPYQSRLKLSLLLGFDVDGSVDPKFVSSLQDNFAFPQESSNQQGNITLSNQVQTDTQRIGLG